MNAFLPSSAAKMMKGNDRRNAHSTGLKGWRLNTALNGV
jgi:hypothetical protein